MFLGGVTNFHASTLVRHLLREGRSWTDFLHLIGHLVIDRLGGTVPAIVEPTSWATRSQKQAQKREARRTCFEELRRLVGPWTDGRLYERKVLDNGMRSSSSLSRDSMG